MSGVPGALLAGSLGGAYVRVVERGLQVIAMSLTGVLAAGCSVFGIRTTAEPGYTARYVEGDKEIRDYESYVIAVVSTRGSYEESGSAAFRLLFDYISGNNVAGQSIAMTAPVLQEPQGTKIEMTAPVVQRREGSVWETAFVLPAEYSFESAPRPLDKRVVLEEVPARTVAAIRFTGLVDGSDIEAKAEELRDWLKAKPFRAVSEPRSARYDPPFAIPFLRRNEVHITVAE